MIAADQRRDVLRALARTGVTGGVFPKTDGAPGGLSWQREGSSAIGVSMEVELALAHQEDGRHPHFAVRRSPHLASERRRLRGDGFSERPAQFCSSLLIWLGQRRERWGSAS